MRNLKRALSLTLASVMLLGMMVVGAGAAGYPDVDEEDNVEAIEVIQAVGVMVGDDNGNFNPDDQVTRAQMAVILAKLMDLNTYITGTNPFPDVTQDWAIPSISACYTRGYLSGYDNGNFGPNDPVTAVQAASMLMRVVGYFKYPSDYKDGFEVATVRQAGKIELFENVDTTKANDTLTRSQVAQLILNALKTPTVEPDDNTINITDGDGKLLATGGQVNYVVVASKQNYAQTIDNTEYVGSGLNQVQGYTVELGEQRYKGELQLNNNAEDDFGRPARQWEYNGKEIGTYYKKELMVKEYVGKVTGKDLYDLLGSATINGYNLNVAVDGVDQDSADAGIAGVFGAGSMDKNNKAAVGRTGTGTLTQVFVDNKNAAVNKDGKIYISIINTYLAKASRDYDEKKEELAVTIHGAYRNPSTDNYIKDSVKNARNTTSSGSTIPAVNLSVEDLPIVKNLKKDDFLLVTVASGEVKTAVTPETLSGVKISGFKINDDVVVDGQKYNFATTAHYKDSDLKKYTSASNNTINLKDTTYNIYLDAYGNLVGVEEVNAVKNYVFITGIDLDGSNIVNKTGRALGLFLDGTSETITYKTDKGDGDKLAENVLVNTWCTYTKDNSGVYTLNQVASALDPDNDGKNENDLAQFATQDATASYNANGITINSKNITLNTDKADGSTDDKYIYGKESTVYLIAELGVLNKTTRGDNKDYGVVKDVDSVVVNVKSADIKVWSKADAKSNYNDLKSSGKYDVKDWAYGAYALYDDDNSIIAAVVVGEDNGSSKQWYRALTSGLEHEDYNGDSATKAANDDQWTWSRKMVDEKGNEVILTEVGDSSEYLVKMVKNHSYLIKQDANGNVAKAYRVPGDTDGGKLPDAPNTIVYKVSNTDAQNKDAEVVNDDTLIGAAISTGKSHMLVDCEITNDKMKLVGKTFYVSTDDASGFIVTDDTKVVVQQINRNNEETYIEGTGSDYLKGVVDDINSRNNQNTYNYHVSAVLNSGVAQSIVIEDPNPDFSVTPITPEIEGVVAELDEKTGTVNVTFTDTAANNTDLQNAVVNELVAHGYKFVDATGVTLTSFTTPKVNKASGSAKAVSESSNSWFSFAVRTTQKWTIKVDGQPWKTVNDCASYTIAANALSGAGTGYVLTSNDAYHAYDTAWTWSSGVTHANRVLETGYIQTINGTNGNGIVKDDANVGTISSATADNGTDLFAKVADGITVTAVWAQNGGATATDQYNVWVEVTTDDGITKFDGEKITGQNLIDGTVTRKFEITGIEKDITGIEVKGKKVMNTYTLTTKLDTDAYVVGGLKFTLVTAETTNWEEGEDVTLKVRVSGNAAGDAQKATMTISATDATTDKNSVTLGTASTWATPTNATYGTVTDANPDVLLTLGQLNYGSSGYEFEYTFPMESEDLIVTITVDDAVA